ncbi:MAG: hypothetical protein HC924_12580 [Synechococcaceae cyanobacterium SM2_3_2]|nr:hypothetical protein [Synechococcaceae cyanobacterium SM2_3_2]
MSPTLSPQPAAADVFQVPRSDRWRILYRLQELELTCGCTPTDQLWVMICTPNDVLLVHSVLWPLSLNRAGLVNWLNHCWSIPPTLTASTVEVN